MKESEFKKRKYYNCLVGKVYGRLTVLKQSDSLHTRGKKGKLSARKMWLCRCDCGNTLKVSGTKLRLGEKRFCNSCAFKSRPQSTIKYSNDQKVFKRSILDRARKAGIEVTLTLEEFLQLAFKDCFYCGEPPSERKHLSSRGIIVKINGLDRVNNNLGYSLSNCVPCCKDCNTAKNSMSLEQFKNKITQIYIHFVKGENGP